MEGRFIISLPLPLPTDLLEDALEIGVGLVRLHLELEDEAVDLVQHQARLELLHPRLAQHSMGLREGREGGGG